MVTIYDIAERANCSAMTVSRVINNSGRISEKTRQRVLKIMEEMNYVPNSMARSLVLQETKTISLLIPDITNPFFTTLARGAEDVAKEQGYNLILSNSDEDLHKERSYIETMLSYRVDGIMIAPALKQSLAHLQMLRKHNMPFVVIDRTIEGIDADHVLGNNKEDAITLMHYLFDLGHHRIAFIGGSNEVSTSRLRYEGYCEALHNKNISLNEQLVHQTRFAQADTHELMTTILDQDQRPTAIFTGNNAIAISAIRSLQERGLEVPKHMSIVGFDDLETNYTLDPFLTAIAQPAYEFGATGMRLLIERIREPKRSWQHVTLPSKLIVRHSTRAVP